MSQNCNIPQNAETSSGIFDRVPISHHQTKDEHRRQPSSAAVQDEITKLVQRVFILPDEINIPRIVAFCGVNQGDGCSWVCAHASEVLAGQVNGTVCVVDTNLRSPSLHDYFHCGAVSGFADAAKDSRPLREFARRTSGKNLWLVPAGNIGREPNGALNPLTIEKSMTELRSEFDYVLLDTPPLGAYSDAILLGQRTDGIVFVVGSNYTRREPARIAKESLEAAGVPLLGAVLNKRTFPIPERLYRKL